jgi:hypothetical protein
MLSYLRPASAVRALGLTLLVVVVVSLALGGATELIAQESQLPDRVARGSLRPYWHVFVAYAFAWIVLFAWVVSIARRFARLDPSRNA